MILLRVCLTTLSLLQLAPLAYAATATTTLQMVWPEDKFDLDRKQAFDKALSYLESDEYWEAVARMPQDDREELSRATGVNNPRNISALAQGLKRLVMVDPDAEHYVITLFVDAPEDKFALTLAQRCVSIATRESKYRVAAQSDPEVARLSQEMEKIEDQIQQFQHQLQLSRDISRSRSRTQSRGASIGAPSNLGRVVNPEKLQDQTRRKTMHTQLQRLREQYRNLHQQLNAEVNRAMKGEQRIGLVLIDHPDLEPTPQPNQANGAEAGE